MWQPSTVFVASKNSSFLVGYFLGTGRTTIVEVLNCLSGYLESPSNPLKLGP